MGIYAISCILVILFLEGLGEACDCGLSPTQRILRGSAVPNSQYPWMGSFGTLTGDNGVVTCGAALISKNYAVTAAHCIPGDPTQEAYLSFDGPVVDALENNRDSLHKVKQAIPLVQGDSTGKDIGVLQLDQPVDITPICLPTSGHTYANVQAVMLGYGDTTGSGQGSDQLLEGTVTVPTNDECNDKDPGLHDTEICGGNFNGQPAICSGDSGGPLMYQDPDTSRWILIGVVHGTTGCTRTDNYGIFSRVTSFLDWVNSQSNNEGCEQDTNAA